jgi:endonuclease G
VKTSVLRQALFALLLAAVLPATAGQCPSEQFAGGEPPRIIAPALLRDAQTLCSRFFSVLYSGVSRTPLYSAEHLTKASVRRSVDQARINSFHADSRLPFDGGPILSDYARSGFDRGHMSPNGDMPDRQSQYESFALTNMVPQNPNNNRPLWAAIEATTRSMAASDGDAYVVTGPAFLGNVYRIGNVAVPNYLWKAVYLPRVGVAGAWYTGNTPGRKYEVLSITALQKRIGIDPFPTLPARIKSAGASFPAPIDQHIHY